MQKSIDINDIDNILITDNLIDIRSKYEYYKYHIRNAINIPYMDLIMKPSFYLNKTKLYYIYCQSGKISMKVCSLLNSEGFNIINLNGGLDNYKK